MQAALLPSRLSSLRTFWIWNLRQDTIDRQTMRRKSRMEEEQSVELSAEMAAEKQKRLQQAAEGKAIPIFFLCQNLDELFFSSKVVSLLHDLNLSTCCLVSC